MIYCTQCGEALEDNTAFCIKCGTPTMQNLPNQSGPVRQQPVYYQPIHYRDITGMMIWSCLCLLCCWPLAIYSIVMAAKINHAASQQEADAIYEKVKISCIVNTVFGIVIAILSFLGGFLGYLD